MNFFQFFAKKWSEANFQQGGTGGLPMSKLKKTSWFMYTNLNHIFLAGGYIKLGSVPPPISGLKAGNVYLVEKSTFMKCIHYQCVQWPMCYAYF